MKTKTEYVVYKDGLEVARYDTLTGAQTAIAAYDGDHDIWYEIEEYEVED